MRTESSPEGSARRGDGKTPPFDLSDARVGAATSLLQLARVSSQVRTQAQFSEIPMSHYLPSPGLNSYEPSAPVQQLPGLTAHDQSFSSQYISAHSTLNGSTPHSTLNGSTPHSTYNGSNLHSTHNSTPGQPYLGRLSYEPPSLAPSFYDNSSRDGSNQGPSLLLQPATVPSNTAVYHSNIATQILAAPSITPPSYPSSPCPQSPFPPSESPSPSLSLQGKKNGRKSKGKSRVSPQSPQPQPLKRSNSISSNEEGGSSKKKKAYIPSYVQDGEKCVVCGDESTGTHYRAMTCEGCKGFFRRTIQKMNAKMLKNEKYDGFQCKKSNNCVITLETRTQCQACRFKKCLDQKMDVDSVLEDNDRIKLQEKIQTNRHERMKKAQENLTPEEEEVLKALGKSFKGNHLAGHFFNFLFFPSMEAEMEALQQSRNGLIRNSSPGVAHVLQFIQNIPGLSEIPVEDILSLAHHRMHDIFALGLAEVFRPQTGELCFRNKTFNRSDLKDFDWMSGIYNYAKYYAEIADKDGIILGCLGAMRFLCPEDNPDMKPEVIKSLEAEHDKLCMILLKYLKQNTSLGISKVLGGLMNFERIRLYQLEKFTFMCELHKSPPIRSDQLVPLVETFVPVQSSASNSPLPKLSDSFSQYVIRLKQENYDAVERKQHIPKNHEQQQMNVRANVSNESNDSQYSQPDFIPKSNSPLQYVRNGDQNHFVENQPLIITPPQNTSFRGQLSNILPPASFHLSNNDHSNNTNITSNNSNITSNYNPLPKPSPPDQTRQSMQYSNGIEVCRPLASHSIHYDLSHQPCMNPHPSPTKQTNGSLRSILTSPIPAIKQHDGSAFGVPSPNFSRETTKIEKVHLPVVTSDLALDLRSHTTNESVVTALDMNRQAVQHLIEKNAVLEEKLRNLQAAKDSEYFVKDDDPYRVTVNIQNAINYVPYHLPKREEEQQSPLQSSLLPTPYPQVLLSNQQPYSPHQPLNNSRHVLRTYLTCPQGYVQSNGDMLHTSRPQSLTPPTVDPPYHVNLPDTLDLSMPKSQFSAIGNNKCTEPVKQVMSTKLPCKKRWLRMAANELQANQ